MVRSKRNHDPVTDLHGDSHDDSDESRLQHYECSLSKNRFSRIR